MDVYEIAVNFQDAAHQGDRRKKSQQCHMKSFCKIFEWFSIFIILLPTNTFTCFKWFHVTIRKTHMPKELGWCLTGTRLGWCLWAFERGIRQVSGTPWLDCIRPQGKGAGSSKP